MQPLIKCIATDMDGTLLNSKEKISPENARAIKEAQNNGIEVVVATGRAYVEAKHMLNEANIKCPVISTNGAVVFDQDGKIIASNPMNIEEYKMTRNILDELGIYYEVYTNKGIFSRDKAYTIAMLADIFLTAMPHLDVEYLIKQASKRFELGHVSELDNYDDLYQDLELEYYKVLAFSVEPDKLLIAKERLLDHTALAISSSGKENIEITSTEAQKGNALQNFANSKGIPLKQTMAIGDSYNDVSMFMKVGRPVAMANANTEIKQICGHVTKTNEEDGVAYMIAQVLTANELVASVSQQ